MCIVYVDYVFYLYLMKEKKTIKHIFHLVFH